MQPPAPSALKQISDYVNRPAPRQPSRLILYATEGWGKTSFAAMAPEPIFLLTRGETGLWTLINSGRLPGAVAHFPKPAEKWPDMFQARTALRKAGRVGLVMP